MAYVVHLKKSAEKELEDLPAKIHDRVVNRLLSLKENPRPAGASELRGALNEKNKSIRDNPIFKHVETSNLLGMAGSHDRAQDISKGDIEVAIGDIDKLEKLFRCSRCNTLVYRRRFVAAEKKITCKCGGLSLDWKE